jgi:hypothetical protein
MVWPLRLNRLRVDPGVQHRLCEWLLSARYAHRRAPRRSPLTEPTAAVQQARPERVFMPRSSHCEPLGAVLNLTQFLSDNARLMVFIWCLG